MSLSSKSTKGKGKGKAKAKFVVNKEEPIAQRAANASDNQIKKLRSLDVFAGCGGKLILMEFK